MEDAQYEQLLEAVAKLGGAIQALFTRVTKLETIITVRAGTRPMHVPKDKADKGPNAEEVANDEFDNGLREGATIAYIIDDIGDRLSTLEHGLYEFSGAVGAALEELGYSPAGAGEAEGEQSAVPSGITLPPGVDTGGSDPEVAVDAEAGSEQSA